VQLCRDQQRYHDADLQIVLIGLGTPEKARQFRQDLNLPFTVLCDPEKRSYRAFGLTRRLNLLRELHPQSAARLVAAMRQHGGAATGQDMLQLGGVFVVDRAGIVRFAFTALRMADQPALEDVLRAVAGNDQKDIS
jgi:peroxiredoxin